VCRQRASNCSSVILRSIAFSRSRLSIGLLIRLYDNGAGASEHVGIVAFGSRPVKKSKKPAQQRRASCCVFLRGRGDTPTSATCCHFIGLAVKPGVSTFLLARYTGENGIGTSVFRTGDGRSGGFSIHEHATRLLLASVSSNFTIIQGKWEYRLSAAGATIKKILKSPSGKIVWLRMTPNLPVPLSPQ
jgi:hypothetical protein